MLFLKAKAMGFASGKRLFSGLFGLLCLGSLAAVTLSGCGGASADQIQLLRSEVFSLKQDQRQLRHELTALDSLIHLRTQSLDTFNADFGADVRSLSQRLLIVEQRLSDTEQLLVRLQSSVVSGQSAQSPGGKSGQPARTDPRQIFDLAYKDYNSGNYEIAIDGFRDFLERYADSTLAPEASLYIGNSYRELKKYREAIASFRTIVEKYPTSPNHPDALVRIGDCLVKLGDKSRAETYYQSVIQKFPDSNAAAIARARLNP